MRSVLPTLSLLALTACSSSPSPFSSPDSGVDVAVVTDHGMSLPDVVPSFDAPRTVCTSGGWVCSAATTALQCNADGTVASTVTCTAGQTCQGGSIGCGVCSPGATRCDPSAIDTPSICAADGSAWTDRLACDTASGENCVNGACARPCDTTGGNANSYLGCEYWPTVTANAGLNYQFDFAAVLANPGAADAHVTITGGTLGSTIARTVPAGGVVEVSLPWVDALKGSGEGCFQFPPQIFGCASESTIGLPSAHAGAYHIISDAPLAAYQFNALEYRTGTGASAVYSYTNDASLLLPQAVLGDPRNQDYVAVARPNWAPMGETGVYGGFVTVVGTGPLTTPVTVTLTTTATVGDPNNPLMNLMPGTYTYALPRGAVVQLIGINDTEDLTGTRVTANGPIAVFSGNDCTYVPIDRVACDHLEQQMLPTSTWGRRYAVSFLRDRQADPNEFTVVRIVARSDGTALTFDGIAPPGECAAPLAAGGFCEFQTSDSFQVTATAPVMVTQWMVGLGDSIECQVLPGMTPVEDNNCVGDPAMALEIPIEQYRSRYDLLIPSTYNLNYVNTVAPTGTVITVDGMAPDPTTLRGPFPVGTGYEVNIIALTPGAHTLLSTGQPFGAKVYGVALYTSYMYPAGLDLEAINPPE